MKLNIKAIAAIAIIAGAASSAWAQQTRSGYFVDEYTYRFQMNPALGNEKGYVSMPVLGNMNIGTYGNYGITDLLYIVDGRTSLFLNPNVPAAEVMKNLSKSNKLGAEIGMTLLSVGFKGIGGYNTVSINLKASANTQVPKGLFAFLKEGVSNRSYSFSGLRAQADAYVEAALNHSHDINKEWRVGGSLKFLFGAGDLNADFKTANLALNEDSWNIEAEGRIDASVKGLEFETDHNDRTGRDYVNGFKMHTPGMNGFGMAFDLGAVYKPAALRDWEFSIAFTDLGFMHWNNTQSASTLGLQTVNTGDYSFNVDDDAPNSFDNEMDKLKDNLSMIYELQDEGNTGGRTTGLAATMNVGAEYTLPVYRPLTFGLLNTTRINGPYSWTDFRLSANISPAKGFSAGVNMAMGTFGFSCGALINLHVTGFNLFLGMDHIPGKYTKDGVPLGSNAQVNMGMNFLF